MKTFRYFSMLLMAVTLAFGMSSCSSDDDDDEPLPDDGWGQVDDEDEPSGGEEQLTEDALTGYWTRRSAVDGEKEAVRFTPDGIIAYEYSKDDGWDEVSVIAQGNYFVEGGRIRAVYLDIHVDTPYGDDVYGDFDENAICEIFYDAAIYRNGMSHSLILGNSLGGGKAFEKYESEGDWARLLTGSYTVYNENKNISETIRFTSDGRMEYRQSGYSGSLYFEITADGTFRLDDDMSIVAYYNDVSVQTSDGRESFNTFTDGEPSTVRYYLLGLYDFLGESEDLTILRMSDVEFMKLHKTDDGQTGEDDEPDTSDGSILGAWTYGSAESGRVEGVYFDKDGTGVSASLYYDDYGDESWWEIYNFIYEYDKTKGIVNIWSISSDECQVEGVWRVSVTGSKLILNAVDGSDRRVYNVDLSGKDWWYSD